MTDKDQALRNLHTALGYKPLNRAWAKGEIIAGLAAAGVGLLMGGWWVTYGFHDQGWWIASSLALFVLGGYLAMAGHRSHLYQSNNELTAYLVREIHRLKDQG